MDQRGGNLLLPVEAEAYVQAIEEFGVKSIGCPKWFSQQERIEKLNMQSVQTASAQEDEFVKEFLINEAKIPALIHELITIEVWKEKIFPEFVKMQFQPRTTFPLYMVLYHEATLINLLETILYHQDACEAAGDSILDLVDYCYRRVVWLLLVSQEEHLQSSDSRAEPKARSSVVQQGSGDLDASGKSMEELVEQDKALQFDISIKALSIIRYATDHLAVLPLSVTTRLLNTHDVPVLLVDLMQASPWERQRKVKAAGDLSSAATVVTEKYIDNKWREVPADDRFKVTKTEGQVWLALYHLLMDQQCQQQYELNTYRKNVLLKLRSFLTEILLDQLPAMTALHVYIERLSIMEPPQAKKDLVLEQIPECRDSILQKYDKRWAAIAKQQAEKYFDPDDGVVKSLAKRWADTYSMDALGTLTGDPPTCAMCGEVAAKRCSRCQNEWYCGRECQVKHWPRHKKGCDLLFEAVETAKSMALSEAD